MLLQECFFYPHFGSPKSFAPALGTDLTFFFFLIPLGGEKKQTLTCLAHPVLTFRDVFPSKGSKDKTIKHTTQVAFFPSSLEIGWPYTAREYSKPTILKGIYHFQIHKQLLPLTIDNSSAAVSYHG